jgi:hypothetical protein
MRSEWQSGSQNGGMESGSRKSKTKASNPSETSSGNDKSSGFPPENEQACGRYEGTISPRFQ